MKKIDHPLLNESIGSERTVTSFHFGSRVSDNTGRKIYLQASLHADELPGMLVLHHLIALLEQAEMAGQLVGEVVVVPVANPIGLAQRLDHRSMGRFELASSENFNRHYPDIAPAIWPLVKDHLGQDVRVNTQWVRRAAKDYIDNWIALTQLQSLRKTLLGLAIDADVVLDLHCDSEAVVHLYAEPTCWPKLEPLACLLGARAVLLANATGARCFDEALSGLWWQLLSLAQADGCSMPIEQSCVSATVELRGERDVSHALAMCDANALMQYLYHLGIVVAPDNHQVALPSPLCEATPLAGTQPVRTPVPGVVVFAAELGRVLKKGDLVAEVIQPLAPSGQQVYPVRAEVDGVLYARTRERYALANDKLANIAGAVPYRTGNLLGN